MTRILINFVLIFIIVSYELMTVWSRNNTLGKTWSRKNITHALKGDNVFLFFKTLFYLLLIFLPLF